jgi:hypothetical protein
MAKRSKVSVYGKLAFIVKRFLLAFAFGPINFSPQLFLSRFFEEAFLT